MQRVKRYLYTARTASGDHDFEVVPAIAYDSLLDDVLQHNAECQRYCGEGDQEAVACGHRPYFVYSGRRCPNCPTSWKIEISQTTKPDLSGLEVPHGEA